MNILKDILKVWLSWFCFAVLSVMGWKTDMHKETLYLLNRTQDDLVLLFQHTTYFDIGYGVLFAFANGISDRLFFIMSSEVANRYWYLKPLFRAVGCIFIPAYSSSPQGSVQKVTELLSASKVSQKIILVSPVGNTRATAETKWRTGWYHLARNIGAKIGTIGVNFHPLIRTIHLGQPEIQRGAFIDPHEVSLERCIDTCRDSIGTIFPRWKAHSCAPLRTPTRILQTLTSVHTPSFIYHTTPEHAVCFVDLTVLSAYMFLIPWLATVGAGYYDLSVVGGCAVVASIMYHSSYELDRGWHDADMKTTCFAAFYFILHIMVNVYLHQWFVWLMSLAACLQVFLLACPRKGLTKLTNGLYRSKEYDTFHAMFHVLLSMVIFSYSCGGDQG